MYWYIFKNNLKGEDQLCGDVHAICFANSVPANSVRLHQELRAYLQERLVFIDDGSEPDPRHLEHKRGIIQHTLRRQVDIIRSRNDDLFKSGAAAQMLADAAEQKLGLLNGDPRLPYPVHICGGRRRPIKTKNYIYTYILYSRRNYVHT